MRTVTNVQVIPKVIRRPAKRYSTEFIRNGSFNHYHVMSYIGKLHADNDTLNCDC